MQEKYKAQELLDKVYSHLETIDISKLSMNELKDFLEVVQKGQFLESYGKVPSFGSMYGFNSALQPDVCCCDTKRADQTEQKLE